MSSACWPTPIPSTGSSVSRVHPLPRTRATQKLDLMLLCMQPSLFCTYLQWELACFCSAHSCMTLSLSDDTHSTGRFCASAGSMSKQLTGSTIALLP